MYVRTSDELGYATASAPIELTSGLAEDQIAAVAGLGSLYQAPDGTTFRPQGLREDQELRGLSNVDISNSLGLGSYNGQLRRGADGQLYEWVQSVDGLGNLSGFWKSLSKVAQAVAKPVVKAATDVAKGAVQLLKKPQCIPLLPLRAPIRLIAKAICPIVQQPVVKTIAPLVPYVGPIIQGAGRFCNLATDCGIAGFEGRLRQAPDVRPPGQPYVRALSRLTLGHHSRNQTRFLR
jgi:hypothetical protein